MSESLTAYVGGDRAGRFTRIRGGTVEFVFDDEWRARARRMELSLSMPKSKRRHTGSAPENYLWNLLPDSEAVLERWGSRFGVSPRNPLAILAHVGMDTAGAVQLNVEDLPVLDGHVAFSPIDDTQIAAHIRELNVAPDAWLLPGQPAGYFSLAGAQSKFALAQTPDGWAIPLGTAASTHIFKPGIRGLDHSDLNEHLTMAAAAGLGLDVAESRVMRFDGASAIVILRYDRVSSRPGTVVERLHQEDLAQATGTHPGGKYQNEGGPGIRTIAEVIRGARGRDAAASVERFFDAAVFNWVVLGTDAHAKNYSLLHDRDRGPRLAPLYDLASALPYPEVNTRRAEQAMSFARHYRQFEIEPRHVLSEGESVGVTRDHTIDTARRMVKGVAEAYSAGAAAAGLDGEDRAFAARLVDAVADRAAQLKGELDHASSRVE